MSDGGGDDAQGAGAAGEGGDGERPGEARGGAGGANEDAAAGTEPVDRWARGRGGDD